MSQLQATGECSFFAGLPSVHVYRLGVGQGRKWHPPALLYSDPTNPCPSSTNYEISRSSPSCIPQAFFKLLLLGYISVGLFVMLSL